MGLKLIELARIREYKKVIGFKCVYIELINFVNVDELGIQECDYLIHWEIQCFIGVAWVEACFGSVICQNMPKFKC